MKQSTANKILNDVKLSYSAIAADFNASRQTLWPGFENFLQYVKVGDKVLDLGCGNGRLLNLFTIAKVDYTGIDNNEQLIALAKKNHPDQKFQSGDILNLPFNNEGFDVIFCVAALHHIPSKPLRQKAMFEIKRPLKPGGILILTSWNLYQPKYLPHLFKSTLLKLLGRSALDFKDSFIPFGQAKIPRYYHYFTLHELRQLVNQAGFKIISSSRDHNLVIIAEK